MTKHHVKAAAIFLMGTTGLTAAAQPANLTDTLGRDTVARTETLGEVTVRAVARPSTTVAMIRMARQSGTLRGIQDEGLPDETVHLQLGHSTEQSPRRIPEHGDDQSPLRPDHDGTRPSLSA